MRCSHRARNISSSSERVRVVPAACPASTSASTPAPRRPGMGRRPCVVEAQVLGLVDGPLEAAAREHVGEVDERAAGGVTGMPSTSGAVLGWDVAAVDEDPIRPRDRSRRARSLDERRSSARSPRARRRCDGSGPPPHRRRARRPSAAHCGVGQGGRRRTRPGALDAAGRRAPARDRARRRARAPPAGGRETDPVLARGKVGNQAIHGGCVVFWMYASQKSTHPPFTPPFGAAPAGRRPSVP